MAPAQNYRVSLFQSCGLWVATGLMFGFGAAKSAAESAVSERVDAVLANARSSGKPILAIAGYTNCAPCRALKAQMASNAELQTIAGYCLPLALTIDGDGRDEWRRWQKMTDTSDRSSPQIFVIRADGKLLFGGKPPAELASFLQQTLKQSGRSLSTTEATQAGATLAQAKLLAERGDKALAIDKVAALIKFDSFAGAVVESRTLQETWLAELKSELPTPSSKLENNEAGIQSAYVLVGIAKNLAKPAPTLAKEANKQLAYRRRNPAEAEVIAQAERLYQVASLPPQNIPKVKEAYQKLIESNPDSPVGKLAQARIERIKLSP